MLEHPDFFNMRKTAIALAGGPLALLLVIVVVDFSWNQFKLRQAAQLCTKLTPAGVISKLDASSDCPQGFPQEVQSVK